MSETKINALRKKYEQGNIHIIDLIRYLDPTKNKILTDILAKEIIANSEFKSDDIKERLRERADKLRYWSVFFDNLNEDIEFLSKNYLMGCMILMLAELMEDRDQLSHYLKLFNKYWEENKIPHGDLSKFQSIQDIKDIVDELEIKEYEKEHTLHSLKFFENEQWVLLVPLSRKASLIYGAHTKWCTTDRKDENPYYEYTNNGLLIYIIDKNKNIKFAYHKRKQGTMRLYPGYRHSQFFNEADIIADSLDLNIPYDILLLIKKFVDECRMHPIVIFLTMTKKNIKNIF
jgi:hypothetical protein